MLPSVVRWSAISRILFELDPMGTACKENGCQDEYDRVARGVVERHEAGEDLDKALVAELSDWFGMDLVRMADLDPVRMWLKGMESEEKA